MFQPNATERDEYDYHRREVDYHVHAVYGLRDLILNYLDAPDWRSRLGTVARMIRLQQDHNTMAFFHVRRLEALSGT